MANIRNKDSGFSLIELMVSLLIMTAVIVGVLALFDSTNQLAKGQINRVNLQQSLRIAQNEMVRMIRLAGRGGLPISSTAALLPDGWAVSIANNVKDQDVINAPSAPEVVDGTDVLTIRGVISTPIYFVRPNPTNPLVPRFFDLDQASKTGFVVIHDTTPSSNQPQELDALREMLQEGTRPEALILQSASSDDVFGVVEIDYSASLDSGSTITLAFKYGNSTHADQYALLSSDGKRNPGVFPEQSLDDSDVGTVGILEEYHFYLRQGQQMDNPDELTTALGGTVRKLSRARTYPTVDQAYADLASNLRVDIAENILDFQLALAFDQDENGEILESDTGEADEWLGNSANDDPTDVTWTVVLAEAPRLLRLLRLTTLARTQEGDRNHEAAEIPRLEDHEFMAGDPLNDLTGERKYPRIVYRTHVDLRNI